jgi:hypothetical protein
MNTRDLCWLSNARRVGRLTLSAAEIKSFEVGSVRPEVLLKSLAFVGIAGWLTPWAECVP